MWMSYRQDSQQRSLASILEADHRDIHLRGPAIGWLLSASWLRERQENTTRWACKMGAEMPLGTASKKD
jgi:hypothetical protein